jgi:hypothetical protein
MNIRQAIRQTLITCINCGIRRAGYRIVGIPVGARVFVNNAGPRMSLPGQVLELGYTGVLEIVRIIHHCHRLMPFAIEGAMSELERAVGQRPKAQTKVLVDRSGVNQLAKSTLAF